MKKITAILLLVVMLIATAMMTGCSESGMALFNKCAEKSAEDIMDTLDEMN